MLSSFLDGNNQAYNLKFYNINIYKSSIFTNIDVRLRKSLPLKSNGSLFDFAAA